MKCTKYYRNAKLTCKIYPHLRCKRYTQEKILLMLYRLLGFLCYASSSLSPTNLPLFISNIRQIIFHWLSKPIISSISNAMKCWSNRYWGWIEYWWVSLKNIFHSNMVVKDLLLIYHQAITNIKTWKSSCHRIWYKCLKCVQW